MDLNMQIKFATVYSELYDRNHDLATIGKLVKIVRENRYNISLEAMRTLLQIPVCVLKNFVTIKDETKWAKENADYFSGNCSSDEYYSTVYQSENFTLEDVIKHIEFYISSDDKLKHSNYLRNAEVVLNRDGNLNDFALVNFYFKNSGLIFANVMKKAFEQ